jgi:hypothetical protein
MLTDAERAALRATQEMYLPDTCRIVRRNLALDSYGEGRNEDVDGPEIPCGFEPGGSEYSGIDGLPVEVDGTLRLPIGQWLTEQDRVRVLRRAGVALSPELEFSIVPPVRLGPTAIVLKLKRVTQ